MNAKKAKAYRKLAKQMATTGDQYITKTTTVVETDPVSGQVFQITKTQTRLLDTSPKRILKLMKQGKVTPSDWETETLLKNGYKVA